MPEEILKEAEEKAMHLCVSIKHLIGDRNSILSRKGGTPFEIHPLFLKGIVKMSDIRKELLGFCPYPETVDPNDLNSIEQYAQKVLQYDRAMHSTRDGSDCISIDIPEAAEHIKGYISSEIDNMIKEKQEELSHELLKLKKPTFEANFLDRLTLPSPKLSEDVIISISDNGLCNLVSVVTDRKFVKELFESGDDDELDTLHAASNPAGLYYASVHPCYCGGARCTSYECPTDCYHLKWTILSPIFILDDSVGNCKNDFIKRGKKTIISIGKYLHTDQELKKIANLVINEAYKTAEHKDLDIEECLESILGFDSVETSTTKKHFMDNMMKSFKDNGLIEIKQ